jgi:hypothetical protein
MDQGSLEDMKWVRMQSLLLVFYKKRVNQSIDHAELTVKDKERECSDCREEEVNLVWR